MFAQTCSSGTQATGSISDPKWGMNVSSQVRPKKEVSPQLLPNCGPWSPADVFHRLWFCTKGTNYRNQRARLSCRPQHTLARILGCHLLEPEPQTICKEGLP
uniref:Uncharacterized protein n=1 Tax=Arundo donax TaxID=35708 RepID=A0A0A9FX22_ARUDO